MVIGHSFITFIGCIHLYGVSQICSDIPKDVLVRWKTYLCERYPPRVDIWYWWLSGRATYIGNGGGRCDSDGVDDESGKG